MSQQIIQTSNLKYGETSANVSLPMSAASKGAASVGFELKIDITLPSAARASTALQLETNNTNLTLASVTRSSSSVLITSDTNLTLSAANRSSTSVSFQTLMNLSLPAANRASSATVIAHNLNLPAAARTESAIDFQTGYAIYLSLPAAGKSESGLRFAPISYVSLALNAGTRASTTSGLAASGVIGIVLDAQSRALARTDFNPVSYDSLTLSALNRASSGLEFRLVTNVSLTLAGASASSSYARLVPLGQGEMTLMATSKASAGLTLRLLRVSLTKLILSVRIVPKTRVGRHKDKHRFTVGAAEIPISDYTVDFPEGSAGCVVNLTLSKFADRSLIVEGANYKFEVGKRIGGAWQWRTIINTGALQGSSLTVGFGDRKRADVFSLSTSEPLANRLAKAPLNDLTIYDNLRVSSDELNTEVLYDTEGKSFAEEKLAIANLTVYKLFDEIFKKRCGFAAWKTNIPDVKLKEARFDMGGTYLDGVAPAIGIFEPDFTEVGGVLWIR
ncbi:MAG TPA: hypothetical protein VNI84_04575, partial [Pyrinomonadaceae bacterium]|nr:hypothetical protein [Pyrinomonadaceae bacterium]